MEKEIDKSLMDLLFSEHISFDEIYVDDYAAKVLSNEDCILIMTEKMVETEN